MADKQYITIDGIEVEMERGLNVLEHAKKAGVSIPAFCYYPELSIYGACRMCLVEIIDQRTGRASLDSSCSLLPKAGMVIKTDSARLKQYRRGILELLIANHCADCTICPKNLNCKLQDFAARFGIRTARYPNRSPRPILDGSSLSITKDKSKCISCGACIRMCNGVQGVGAIDFAGRGSEMIVACSGNKPLVSSNCTSCGQCARVCPTGSITIKDDTERVRRLLDDKSKKVSVMITPEASAQICAKLGLKDGCFGKVSPALTKLGFSGATSVDECYKAAVEEESAALLARKSGNWPLFSSDCPAWVKFAENEYPETLPYLSKTKAALFRNAASGAVESADAESVSGVVSPCAAAKTAITRPEYCENGKQKTVFALSPEEIVLMLKQSGIGLDRSSSCGCSKEGKDKGESYSGDCGAFSEAVLKKAFPAEASAIPELRCIPPADAKAGAYKDCIRAAEFKAGSQVIRAAAVSTLAAAGELIERIKGGERFDYVEVKACPGGCGAEC